MVETEAGTDLPAGIIGEPSDLHTMNGTARARGLSLIVAGKSSLALTRASSKLHGKTLAQEVGSILIIMTRQLACDSKSTVGVAGYPASSGTYEKL